MGKFMCNREACTSRLVVKCILNQQELVYLAVRQEDMERTQLLQSKILANDLTDPLLTHFRQKRA